MPGHDRPRICRLVSPLVACGIAILACWPTLPDAGAAREKDGLASSLREAEERLEKARQSWHLGRVMAAALSADGELALTGGADRAVRLSSVKTGKTIHRLEGHDSTILSVALSGDAKRAVSASSDRTIHLWDLERGKPLQRFRGHADAVGCVACTSDGRIVASGSPDGSVRLWDGETGKPLHVLAQKAPVTVLALAPGGKQLVSGGSDGSLCTWDVQTGKSIRRQTEHTDAVLALAFDAPGERLVSVGGAVKYDAKQKTFSAGDNTARVWHAGNGKLLKSIPVEGILPMTALFAREGLQIHLAGVHVQTVEGGLPDWLKFTLTAVTGGAGGVLYLYRFPPNVKQVPLAVGYEIESGKPVQTTPYQERFGLPPIAFSADGKSGLSAVLAGNHAVVWDRESGKPRQWLGLKGPLPLRPPPSSLVVLAMACSPDGTRMVGGGTDRALYLWDTESGKPMLEIGAHAHPLSAAALSPDGKFALSAAGWTNDEKNNPAFAYLKKPTGGKAPPALEPDAKPDSRLRLWDVEQMTQIAALEGHTGRINQVVFSADGSLAASASADQTVCIWDVAKEKLLHRCTGHKARVNCVAFSPDGKRVASGGGDKMVRIWDTANGKEVGRCTGHGSSVWAVAISPDGKAIASAGGDIGNPKSDLRIILWNNTGKRLRETPGHTGPAFRLSFDADGGRLYSMAEHELKVWDPTTAKEVRTLHFAGTGIDAAFAPASRRGVTSKWGSLYHWDLEAGLYLGTLALP